MLTPDMRAVIDAARLCFVATVTPDGRPNLSPKGTIGVWDDTRLFFLDIASPGTRANLAHSSWMEINVVEQLSRRGYRFSGRAEHHTSGSKICDEALRRMFGDSEPPYAIAGVVLLEVESSAPLFSPAYWRVEDELAIREIWRERREALDGEFEKYISSAGPARVRTSDA